VVVEFIDGHRHRFGVQPICRVLTEHGCKIAPSTYYAFRARRPSARARADAALLPEIRRVHADRNLGRGLYGVRKVWAQLHREGLRPPRCRVERLMRAAGLRGVHRGRQFVTTRPDTTAVRPPDLVNRDFTANRANALWIVDFTYVPTWSGMAFTAFVSDVFSRCAGFSRVSPTVPRSLRGRPSQVKGAFGVAARRRKRHPGPASLHDPAGQPCGQTGGLPAVMRGTAGLSTAREN